VARLSESNYGAMRNREENERGLRDGRGRRRGNGGKGKFYSLPAYVPYVHTHNTRMRRHVPLRFCPASRRPFTNTPTYDIRTATLIAYKPGCVRDFRVYIGMNTLSLACDSTEFSLWRRNLSIFKAARVNFSVSIWDAREPRFISIVSRLEKHNIFIKRCKEKKKRRIFC